MAHLEVIGEFNDFEKGILVGLLTERRKLIELSPEEIEELTPNEFDNYVFEMNTIKNMINKLVPKFYKL